MKTVSNEMCSIAEVIYKLNEVISDARKLNLQGESGFCLGNFNEALERAKVEGYSVVMSIMDNNINRTSCTTL